MIDHLPERNRPGVKQRLRRAWALEDHARALDQLRQLAGELDHSYPGAAGMLEAEQQFRKIIGYRDLATLVIAIEHDSRPHPDPARATREEAAILVNA